MQRPTYAALALLAALVSLSATSTTAAQTASPTDTDARTLFELGENAFESGRYRAALDFFQQAYDLSGRPQLLFNIGQAADRLREDARALAAFEGYLQALPTASNRGVVEARIAILRQVTARSEGPRGEQDDAEGAEATQPVDAASGGPRSGTVALTPPSSAVRSTESGGSALPGAVLLGVGGAAALAGAVVLGLGVHDVHTVEDAADGTSFADVADAFDRAPRRTWVGGVMLGAGAAAAAVGVVLVIRAGSEEAAPPRVALRVGWGNAALVGRF